MAVVYLLMIGRDYKRFCYVRLPTSSAAAPGARKVVTGPVEGRDDDRHNNFSDAHFTRTSHSIWMDPESQCKTKALCEYVCIYYILANNPI